MTATTIIAASDDNDGHDDPEAAEERRQFQLTTLAGWRRHVNDTVTVADLLPRPEWEQLPDAQRESDDERRANYHARLVVVETADVRRAVREGRRLSYLNRNADYGRFGLMLDGKPRTGKTTTLAQMGKTMELIDRRRFPDGRHRIPVVYLTMPPAATAKMMAMEFARFLGLPMPSRANLTDVTDTVCGVLIDASTSLVLVDELHNIVLSTRQGAEVSDTLKYFQERIPATFVYAGTGIKNTLAAGVRGDQIAGRFSVLYTTTIPLGPDWDSLLAMVESSLRLYDYQPGTLLKHAVYLHQRTGGMIGSLIRMIRIAGLDAVLGGSETITKKTLINISLDISAEDEK